MGGKLLVRAVGDVVALGPARHRCHVDIEEHRHELASVAEGHGLLDVREELELVLDVLRREQASVGKPANVLGTVDDLQMAVGVEKPGVAGMNPAVGGLGGAGGFIVLVVADEDARRAVEHLAVVGYLDLHARRRLADRICANLAVGLRGDVDAGLGLSVELLQVEPQRAVEAEDLRADRLAGRVADAHAGEAHPVLERPVDQELAQRVFQPVGKPHRHAVEDRLARAARMIHEVAEHALLESAGILHAHHDLGEQRFEHPRRGEEIGRCDLAPVFVDGLRPLGTTHAIARDIGLRVGEDMVAHPRQRQIGEHHLVGSERVEGIAVARRNDEIVEAEHHALGLAGRARCVEHDREVRALARGDAFKPGVTRAALHGGPSLRLNLRERHEPRVIVVAQAARLVIDYHAQVRAAGRPWTAACRPAPGPRPRPSKPRRG